MFQVTRVIGLFFFIPLAGIASAIYLTVRLNSRR
jgi:hypothetical protein